MPITLTPGQRVTGTLAPLTASGNPAPIDGIPEWSTSNPSVGSVEPSADGMTCVVTAAGGGVTQVGARCDADLGEGTRELTILDDVTVSPEEAVTIGIVWGTPEGGATPTPSAKKSKH